MAANTPQFRRGQVPPKTVEHHGSVELGGQVLQRGLLILWLVVLVFSTERGGLTCRLALQFLDALVQSFDDLAESQVLRAELSVFGFEFSDPMVARVGIHATLLAPCPDGASIGVCAGVPHRASEEPLYWGAGHVR